MPGVGELAAVMMQNAERRIDVTAANISNMTTPGYRSQRVFSQVLDLRGGLPLSIQAATRQVQGGTLKVTGNPLDLAAAGEGVLVLRGGQQFFQTRSAQLQRAADGRLIDAQGRALQSSGGGDVVIGPGTPQILQDGTVLINGQAEAKIGQFAPTLDQGFGPATDMTAFSELPPGSSAGMLRQGMIVPADVDAATEMIELNKASRMAETGAKVFQLYDDLLGKMGSQLGDVRK